ncbi:aminoglycoside phosphotransferase family protein [Listeria grandensis]|uniref:phosphotransferase family protein n=1 Tax=Listeria grandensis TaxID=1494963 RepID=UPI0016243AE7|nr:aminoglycoside phosphotransferase family protein [Listeria grandensis]MBC1475563.1 aminoglycoside phosphotransferase family protein [Listeria grandensis]
MKETVEKPVFESLEAFREQLESVGFWWPHARKVLLRHELLHNNMELVAGTGGTYPTVIYGDVVIKFFGFTEQWRKSYESEKAAQAILAQNRELAVPALLASGDLYEDAWSYLVTTRMSGVSWEHANLTPGERRQVAIDLGVQIGLVHTLKPLAVATKVSDWSGLDLISGAKQSSFPAHLIPQIEAYVARMPALDDVFVHGDLMERHVFIEDGRLTGVIDWGDAMVCDRHYELAKLHLDLFDCDKELLAAFLKASEWPITADFAHKSLVLALYRQAHGLMQHHTMDVFFKLPKLLNLEQMTTLEELADRLFKIS